MNEPGADNAQRWHAAHTRPAAGLAPDAQAEAGETAGRALRLLDALPESQREVVRLKFQAGLSYVEISHVTGHSVSNVSFLTTLGVGETPRSSSSPTRAATRAEFINLVAKAKALKK